MRKSSLDLPSYFRELENLAGQLIGNKSQATLIVKNAFQEMQKKGGNDPHFELLRELVFQKIYFAFGILLNQGRSKNQTGISQGVLPRSNPLPEMGVEIQKVKEWNKVIQDLPVQYREVLNLYYFKGLNTREIAKKLNLSASTVQHRKTRGWYLIKKLMFIFSPAGESL